MTASTAVAPVAMPAVDSLREPVSRGLTRPLAWRRDQLARLTALLDGAEEAILAALAADLAKPPVEAYFEVVAVRQELRLCQRQLRRWMAPGRCRCHSARGRARPGCCQNRSAAC